MKTTAMVIAGILATSSIAYSSDAHSIDSKSIIPEYQKQNQWYIDAKSAINRKGISGIKAKNVILFVGDGMGVSTVTAARILEGQLKGMLGEENNLAMDRFPYTGLAKTYNVDAQTPDSAGTMTAMISLENLQSPK